MAATPLDNDPYHDEAKARWGNTEAYAQSQKRVRRFTKEDWEKIRTETDDNLRALAALMTGGRSPSSPEVQAEIGRHHDGIDRFYDCSAEIYRGLGEMYLADRRFADFYRKYHRDLPEFLVAGIREWCDRHDK